MFLTSILPKLCQNIMTDILAQFAYHIFYFFSRAYLNFIIYRSPAPYTALYTHLTAVPPAPVRGGVGGGVLTAARTKLQTPPPAPPLAGAGGVPKRLSRAGAGRVPKRLSPCRGGGRDSKMCIKTNPIQGRGEWWSPKIGGTPMYKGF